MLDRDSTSKDRMRSRCIQASRAACQMQGYLMKDHYEFALLHCDNNFERCTVPSSYIYSRVT